MSCALTHQGLVDHLMRFNLRREEDVVKRLSSQVDPDIKVEFPSKLDAFRIEQSPREPSDMFFSHLMSNLFWCLGGSWLLSPMIDPQLKSP